mmetsp:Transcript_6264/g.11163  ORF Transcript_6264/g.11163 Transcript_6264/m.11163 type:complete len:182 (+) Transcript_6264:477-1022(+)
MVLHNKKVFMNSKCWKFRSWLRNHGVNVVRILQNILIMDLLRKLGSCIVKDNFKCDWNQQCLRKLKRLLIHQLRIKSQIPVLRESKEVVLRSSSNIEQQQAAAAIDGSCCKCSTSWSTSKLATNYGCTSCSTTRNGSTNVFPFNATICSSSTTTTNAAPATVSGATATEFAERRAGEFENA